MLQLTHSPYQIVISDDPCHTPESADNVRPYNLVYDFTSGQFSPSSQHAVAVELNGTQLRSCVVLAGGGASGVHQHSALIHNNQCLLAIGSFVCSFEIPDLKLLWHTEVDAATCFGIYHAVKHGCYISHGELEVARLSYQGEVRWRAGGKDILTNGFSLHEDHVKVLDWNNEQYRIDIATGAGVVAEV